MSDGETGWKWWVRYVIVPLIGGGGLVAIIVASMSSDRHPSNPKFDQSPPTEPRVASGVNVLTTSGPIELGTYLRGFMLPSGIPEPDWYIGTRDTTLPISWLKPSQLKSVWQRKGIARVKVNGAPLKTVYGEVKWEITVNGTKFGPESVSFEPRNVECFGIPGSIGCEFDILAVMLKSGNDINVLCSGRRASVVAALYLMSSEDRRDAYIVYINSAGSGGGFSRVTLYWKNPFGFWVTNAAEFCKLFYEEHLPYAGELFYEEHVVPGAGWNYYTIQPEQ